jgi:nitrate reductase NapE component
MLIEAGEGLYCKSAMVSKLKGKHPRPAGSRFWIFKLVVYGVLAVAVIGALWYLYLSERNTLDRHGNPAPQGAGAPP